MKPNTLSRRALLQSASSLSLGIFLPWSTSLASPSGLTDADRALISVIEESHWQAPDYVVSKITVHPLLHEHMSLKQISGVRVEVTPEHRNSAGWINYYCVVYGPNLGSTCAGSGCYLPREDIVKWIRENSNGNSWVQRNFATRVNNTL